MAYNGRYAIKPNQSVDIDLAKDYKYNVTKLNLPLHLHLSLSSLLLHEIWDGPMIWNKEASFSVYPTFQMFQIQNSETGYHWMCQATNIDYISV